MSTLRPVPVNVSRFARCDLMSYLLFNHGPSGQLEGEMK